MSIARAQIQERLVEVAARGPSGEFELATGYAISADLILTVRHGLVGAGPVETLMVRFIGEDWQPARSAWNATTKPEEQVDAALIRTSGLRSFASGMRWGLGDYRRAGRVACHGCGFPGFGRTSADGVRVTSESVGISGYIDPLGGLKGERFQLTLDAGSPAPELWKGLSGGPIFVEGELVAIVLSAMRSGQHLWVTPVVRLIANASFGELTGALERRRPAPPPARPIEPSPTTTALTPNYSHADHRALRGDARILSVADAARMSVGFGFYDRYQNPTAEGLPHDYLGFEREGDPLVLDRTTGLVWTGIVARDVDPQDRLDAIDDLNAGAFAGFDDWRLPTLEEGLSLLRPPRRGAYIDPIFAEFDAWFWTSDTDGRRPWLIQAAHGAASNDPVVGVAIRALRRASAEELAAHAHAQSVPELTLRSEARDDLDEAEVHASAAAHSLHTKKTEAKVVPRTLELIEREGRALVVDPHTRLMWQQSGSQSKLPAARAETYINGLNRKAHGGYDDWRLPSVDEALSLMRERDVGGRRFDAIFDGKQAAIWTCDASEAGDRWAVAYTLSATASAGWHSFDQFVRAVRSCQ